MIAAVKEWAWAVFMTALAGGIAGFIAPNSPNMKKYVKLAATVCAAAVMIMPLKNIIASPLEFGAGEFPAYEYAAQHGVADQKIEEIICERINELVYAEFGVYAERVYFEGDTAVLEISEGEPGEIEAFVRSIYFGGAKVIEAD